MIGISINVPDLLSKEEEIFRKYLDEANVDAIIQRYPIREANIIGTIVKELEFKNCGQYEATVLTIVKEDAEAKAIIENLLDGLVAAVAE